MSRTADLKAILGAAGEPLPHKPRLLTKEARVICPYCGDDAAVVTGEVIYPHRPDLFSKFFWLCKPCDAYVGCHPGTKRPLGTLADEDLRRARNGAHHVFDKLWQSGKMSRKAAYKWLDSAMGMQAHEAHMASFDLDQCIRVAHLAEAKLNGANNE